MLRDILRPSRCILLTFWLLSASGASRTTKLDGSAATYSFDPEDWLVKFVREWRGSADAGRSILEGIEAHGALVGQVGPGVVFDHDAAGRVTRILVTGDDPDGAGGDPAPTWETRYAYDPIGNLSSVFDAEGNETRFLYGEGGAPPHYLTTIVDPLGRAGVRNEYDDDGRLVAHVDAKGNRITFAHNVAGRIEQVTDRSGAVTTILYDDEGRVRTKIDPDPDPDDVPPLRTDYAYDSPGNPRRETKISVGLGLDGASIPGQTHTSHLTYNGSGDLIERRESIMVFDVETNSTSTQEVVELTDYDANGNPIRTTDPRQSVTRTLLGPANRPERSIQEGLPGTTSDDIVTTNFYDGAGRLVQTTGPTGVRQRFEYSEEGWLLRSWTVVGTGNLPLTPAPSASDPSPVITLVPPPDGDDIVTSTKYDFLGRAIATTDARGFRTTMQLDAMGRVTSTTAHGDPNTTDDDIVTTTEYDDAGRAVRSVDPLGRDSLTIYDELNRVTRSEGAEVHDGLIPGARRRPVSRSEYDAEGRVTKSFDPLNRATEYEYDSVGRRVKTTYANGDVDDAVPTYDVRGRVIARRDLHGNQTLMAYDTSGRQTLTTDALGRETRTQYDMAGNVIATRDALDRITRFEYDAFGRRIRTILPPATPGGDPAISTTAYDKRGQMISQTDANGLVTKYFYDTLGRMIRLEDPENGAVNTWRYEYDKAGNRVAQIDAIDQRTEWTYDAHGRQKTRKLPMGQVEEMFYDRAGRMVSHEKFGGDLVEFEYDELGRRISREGLGAETDDEFAFDLVGQRLRADDAYGLRTFDYDERGRMIRVNHPTGEAIVYRYDIMGLRVMSAVLDGGTTISMQTMTYDELNRLETVTDSEKGTWTYEYDEVGARSKQINPNGTQTDYHYDARNRLVRLHTFKISFPGPVLTDILDLHYELDAVGNRLAIVEKFGGVEYVRTDYEYDALYRLIREERVGPLAYVREYAYGPTGSRETQTTSRGGAVEETRTYEYDDNDRMTFETVTPSGGSARTIAYSYDDDGNLVEKNDPGEASPIAYEWDSSDRLIGQTGGPDGPLSFLYDSDGNRVEKTVGAGPAAKTTRFLIDAANATGYTQVRRERVATGGAPFLETTRYVIGDDVLAQVRMDHPDSAGVATLSQYHYDGLGTTRALSGPDGDATDATSYYGFGETLASAGDTPNTLLFTGEQYDPNLGFYHLRARYYDPASGRFASLDRFSGDNQRPMSLHRYTYVENMTTAAVDPSGNAVYFMKRQFADKGEGTWWFGYGHGYLLFTERNDPGLADPILGGKKVLHTFSWHPWAWNYPGGASARVKARVWENYPGDMDPAAAGLSYEHILITNDWSQQEHLRGFIGTWIQNSPIGYDKGDPIEDVVSLMPGNTIGSEHRGNDIGFVAPMLAHSPAPDTAFFYSLKEQNCVWWATIMLYNAGITVDRDASRAIARFNGGVGFADEVLAGTRRANVIGVVDSELGTSKFIEVLYLDIVPFVGVP